MADTANAGSFALGTAAGWGTEAAAVAIAGGPVGGAQQPGSSSLRVLATRPTVSWKATQDRK